MPVFDIVDGELSLPEEQKPAKTKKSRGSDDGRYDELFAKADADNNLPPGMTKAIANAETGFLGDWDRRLKAVSPAGAHGPVQFMPGTARRYGLNSVADMRDPEKAIPAAGKYLADIRDTIGNDDPAIMAAGYNAGENNKYVRAGKVPPPSFAKGETHKYVGNVMAGLDRFGKGMESVRLNRQSMPEEESTDSLFSLDGVQPIEQPAKVPEQNQQTAPIPEPKTPSLMERGQQFITDAGNALGKVDWLPPVKNLMPKPAAPKTPSVDPLYSELENSLQMNLNPQFTRQVQQAYEAGTPEVRQKLMNQPGEVGAVARYLDQKYNTSTSVTGLNPALDGIGGRREDVEKRNLGMGMDVQSAQAMADREVRFPGAMKPTGQAQSTTFDFERFNQLKDAGPIARGVEQGVDLLKSQAAGLNKLAADLGVGLGIPGAADYGRAQTKARDKLKMRQNEMGETPNAFNRNLEGAIASTISNAPALVAGLFTGGEAIPLIGMGAQVAGDEYARGVEEGMTPQQSLARAISFGAAEILGEKIGFRGQIDLLKKAAKGNWADFEKLFVKNMAEQVVGEEATTVAQTRIDGSSVGLGDRHMTAAQLLDQMKETLYQTVLQTTIMGTPGAIGAGGRALRKADARYDQPYADAFAPIKDTPQAAAAYDQVINTRIGELRKDPEFRAIMENETDKSQRNSGLERATQARQILAERRALRTKAPTLAEIQGGQDDKPDDTTISSTGTDAGATGKTITPEDLYAGATRRMRDIDRRLNGTPDQRVVDPVTGKEQVIPGEKPNYTTKEEQDELEFLKANIDNPEALAKAYGFTLGETNAQSTDVSSQGNDAPGREGDQVAAQTPRQGGEGGISPQGIDAAQGPQVTRQAETSTANSDLAPEIRQTPDGQFQIVDANTGTAISGPHPTDVDAFEALDQLNADREIPTPTLETTNEGKIQEANAGTPGQEGLLSSSQILPASGQINTGTIAGGTNATDTQGNAGAQAGGIAAGSPGITAGEQRPAVPAGNAGGTGVGGQLDGTAQQPAATQGELGSQPDDARTLDRQPQQNTKDYWDSLDQTSKAAWAEELGMPEIQNQAWEQMPIQARRLIKGVSRPTAEQSSAAQLTAKQESELRGQNAVQKKLGQPLITPEQYLAQSQGTGAVDDLGPENDQNVIDALNYGTDLINEGIAKDRADLEKFKSRVLGRLFRGAKIDQGKLERAVKRRERTAFHVPRQRVRKATSLPRRGFVQRKVAESIGKVLGLKIIYVEAEDGKSQLSFDGTIIGRYNRHVLIAKDAKDAIPRVVLHEALHTLRRRMPQVYANLANSLREVYTPTAVAKHLEERGYDTTLPSVKLDDPRFMTDENQNEEEWVADFFSDTASKPRTLLRVAAVMNRNKPGAGAAFLRHLDNFITTIYSKLSGAGFGAEAAVAKANLQRAQDAVTEALARYAEVQQTGLEPEYDGPEILESKKRDTAPAPELEKPAEEDLKNSLNAMRISPRYPTAVKSTEDPLAEVRLQPDYESAKRDPKALEFNVNLMTEYPNFKGMRGKPETRGENMIEEMKDNLVWLYNHWKPEFRNRSKLWYVGGNRIAHRWADRFGVEPQQVAAVIAATSPQKDWFQNVSLGERILEALVNHADHVWDSRMSDLVRSREWGKKLSKELKYVPTERLNYFEGKSLKDLVNPGDKKATLDMAVWIRAWDEATNLQAGRVITPEGAFSAYLDVGKTGKPVALRWQSFATIGKAIEILGAKDPGDISRLIGENHKVRSFYNNLIAPFDDLDVTIDTHAVAASLLRPLGASDTEVMHNFGSSVSPVKDKAGNIIKPGVPGTSNSSIFGLYGTYSIYAEAYRRAAREVGVLPREMQSITWEAVRGLFRPEQKNDKIKSQADAIWREARKDKSGERNAREEIARLVEGIQDPPWVRHSPGSHEAGRDSSYQGELPGNGVSDTGGRSGSVDSGTGDGAAKRASGTRGTDIPASNRRDSGVNAEVAPNPDYIKAGAQGAAARFDGLPYQAKLRVTRKVGDAVLPKVLDKLGISDYRIEYTMGGFEGLVNPSITIHFGESVSYDQQLEVAKIVGLLWKQKAMIAYNENDKQSGFQTQFVKVTPSQRLSVAEEAELFQAINQRYPDAQGVSTRDGSLVFGNFSEGRVSEKAFHDGIDSAIAGIESNIEYETNSTTFRSDWIEPDTLEGYLEGTRYGKSDSAGNPSGRDIPRWKRDFDAIQAESDRIFEESVGPDIPASTKRKVAGSADSGSVSESGRVRGSDGLLAEPRRPYQGDGRQGATLQGLPSRVKVDGQVVEFAGYAPAQEAARRYMQKAGLKYNPPTTYAKVDKARAKRIADAFDAMAHDPQNAAVKMAYRQMIKETVAQYRAILDTGLKIEFIDFAKTGDPYGNPRNAILDVVENNHLWVFSTRDGFGSNDTFDPVDNPLLQETEFKISGQVALANDLFRAVHDYFGHIKEGVGFRAEGEENAWRAHSAMYSSIARRAMTTETRGQNSWVNYGPFGEYNQTASGETTKYADQKIGLLPKWVSDEGATDIPASNRRPDAASNERAGAGTGPSGRPSYGQTKRGGIRAIGVHYSGAERQELDGSFYGTGAKGEEADRVRRAADKRLAKRIYFYINAGQGVSPEQGVGGNAHTVLLKNLYDINADPLYLADQITGANQEEQKNNLESAIIDAGFDGYVADFGSQRAAVLIGDHKVPVRFEGQGRPQVEPGERAEPNANKRLAKLMGQDWSRKTPEAWGEYVKSRNPFLYERYAASFVGTGEKFWPDEMASRAKKGAKPDIPASNKRGIDARILADTTLPSGSILPSAWKQALTKAMPEIVPQLDSKGVFDGSERMYKDELVRKVRDKLGIQPPDRSPKAAGILFRARDTGRIFLGKRSNRVAAPHTWSAPGGAVEDGEDLDMAARREVSEEMGGMKVLSMRPIAESKWREVTYTTFLADVPTEFTPTLNHEHSAGQWFDPDQLPEGLHPGMQAIKQQVRDAVKKADVPASNRRQTTTPEFKRWFGKSAIVDENGNPRVMYHGTNADITKFNIGQADAIFVTPDPGFASGFAEGKGKEGANVLPVYVTAENPFDYENPDHVRALTDWLVKNHTGKITVTMPRVPPMSLDPADLGKRTGTGNWLYIESKPVQEYLKAHHDGFWVKERNKKNLGVYQPTQIKSSSGNRGSFDAANPDIVSSNKRQTAQKEYEGVVARFKGSDQWLKAPNGKPTNLTERQWVQVRTNSFKAWFGDWEQFANGTDGNGVWTDDAKLVSKVVDENGEPKVVYHGTKQGGFTILDPDKGDGHRSPMVFTAGTRNTSRSYSGSGTEIDMPEAFEPTDPAGYEKLGYAFDEDEDGRVTVINPDGSEVTVRGWDKALAEAKADLEFQGYPEAEEQRGIYSLFLNIRNPDETHFQGGNWDGSMEGWYVVEDESGEIMERKDNGASIFTYEDARDFAEELGGEDAGYQVYGAPETGETTNTAAEEAKRYGHDGAIIREVVDDGGQGGYVEADDVFVIFDAKQAKSATQNTGEFGPSMDLRFSNKRNPIFYSQLAKGFESSKMNAMPGSQWRAWLFSNKAKLGIKDDEIAWTGIEDFLTLNAKEKLTKAEISDYLSQSGVQVQDVMKGDSDKKLEFREWAMLNFPEEHQRVLDFQDAGDMENAVSLRNILLRNYQAGMGKSVENPTKFSTYTIPGGTNYRELLITLPEKPYSNEKYVYVDPDTGEPSRGPGSVRRENPLYGQNSNYRSSHWEEPNVLAHLRFDERTDADGNKVMFIQELQSDWGQEGKKKGFKGKTQEDAKRFFGITDEDWSKTSEMDREAYRHEMLDYKGRDIIPSAPFVTDTKTWVSLALKRAIRHAAENGFDKIAFANGQQNADLYPQLQEFVDSIVSTATNKAGERNVTLQMREGGPQRLFVTKSGQIQSGKYDGKSLDEVIGKEIAERILNNPEAHTLKEDGLKVGGAGMRAFYDQIVPSVANDVLRKLGGPRVGAVTVNTGISAADWDDANSRMRRQLAKDGAVTEQPGFPITPSLQDKALSGMPLFSNKRNVLGQPALATWTMPDDSKLERWTYLLQDKHIDTKRVVERLKTRVADAWDPYLKETLYHGRAAKDVDDFKVGEVRPLLQAMSTRGITIGELETFLWNRHAPEANAQIARINPAYPDGGSGIKTQDALDYLANLPAGKRTDLEALAAQIDAITAGTRRLLVDSGLETQATIDAWEATYSDYIPLQRETDDLAQKGMGTGQGFSTKGSASKRRTGSGRAVTDILANVMMQRERAITRAEKNKVGLALYGLAIQNPNPEFWYPVNPDAVKNPAKVAQELVNMGMLDTDLAGIIQEPTVAQINPRTGLVEYKINPLLRNRDNVLAVRIKGKDRFLFFSTENERAIRMAQSLKNLDAPEMHGLMNAFRMVTRYVSSINTQYNPIFGAVNLIRDTGAGLLNLSTTPLAGKQAEVMSHIMPALTGIYGDLRADRKGAPRRASQWSRLWEEFQTVGGKTGYRDMYATAEDRAKALESELKKIQDGTVKRLTRGLFDWLSDYNETLENAVRLSAYKVGVDSGMTKERAAVMAKELTVNFNRKGQVASQAGSLYAFFNAAVQGTARLKDTVKGPAGNKIVAGGLLMGVIQAVLMAAAGYDDDEPPEFVRERNFIIPLPNGKYVNIPLPLGFHVLPNTSRVITEAFINPDDAGKKIAGLLGSYFEAFNPIGSAGWSVQTIAPTFSDPLVALSENRDSFGKEIAKKDRTQTNPTPGFTRTKDTASWLSKNLAWGINRLTGGTDYVQGAISPTPDQLDFLFGQLTGGVGREVLKIEQAASSWMSGEELPPYKYPLGVGRFVGDTKSQAADANRFYANITKLNELENEIKGRAKDGKDVAGFLRSNPLATLVPAGNQTERAVTELRSRKRKLIEQKAPKATIKALEGQIAAQMKALNDRVRSMAR